MNREELRKYRCGNGATGIIERLVNFSAEEIIIGSFFHTENQQAKDLMSRYEKMMVLAKVNPDRYKKERDSLHIDVASYIHENKLYREWLDFIYIIMTHMEENLILDSYKCEAMETWNYLTNYETVNIYGLTSSNELLICDEVYGDWDIPLMKARKLYDQKKITMIELQERFIAEDRKNGLFLIERNENMIDISIFETMPFIDERTQAIMPKKWMEMARAENLVLPRQWKSTDFYKEQLKKRKYIINRKGCKAHLKNAGNITEVFFMEGITKDKKIVMLYRVTTKKGSFIGFYHVGDDFFFSPYRGSSEKSIHHDLENFVLELYTEIVSGLEKDRKRVYALKEVDDIEQIEDYKASYVYVEFGIYNPSTDQSNSMNRRRGTKQKPHKRDKAIRKLREGQQVSEEAIHRAREEYGIELQEGYTFVRPYKVGGVKDVRKELRSK
ncbi:hypothetical protein ACFVS2_25285 [Brevibacillus sp. NPDC058079]|uniref:hypothetical protein n=1 Tax=Brevibacillus sp. NPDC058079 TaxID=3346330 RepID=UPI0036E18674